jgi:hypothetical protein
MWFKDLEEAGIKRMREHDTGHTFASLFKMYAGDIYDLKVLLNHCNCNVEVSPIQPRKIPAAKIEVSESVM